MISWRRVGGALLLVLVFTVGISAEELKDDEKRDSDEKDEIFPSEDKRHIGSFMSKSKLPFLRKRFLGSLASHNNLPFNSHKRFVGALASHNDMPYYDKRFYGALASHDNLPSFFSEPKRFVGALASHNDLPFVKRGYDDEEGFYDDGYWDEDKRSIQALAKNGFNSRYEPRPYGEDNDHMRKKRHIGAIAKSSSYNPYFWRRLRADKYFDDVDEDYFYDDSEIDDQPLEMDKRFLGTLARSGWFPRQYRDVIRKSEPSKRHIGAMARLGWLPYSSNNYYRTGKKRSIQSLARLGYFTNRKPIYAASNDDYFSGESNYL